MEIELSERASSKQMEKSVAVVGQRPAALNIKMFFVLGVFTFPQLCDETTESKEHLFSGKL